MPESSSSAEAKREAATVRLTATGDEGRRPAAGERGADECAPQDDERGDDHCPICAFLNAQYAALQVQTACDVDCDDETLRFLHPWGENLCKLQADQNDRTVGLFVDATVLHLKDRYGNYPLPDRVLDPYDWEQLTNCLIAADVRAG